ncbi:secreted protein [Phakopsora pachyrhizi]|uniref:Secreted protein n=1 Tax=Phakopsora pachyrhizi TaxID=170000 RepID=A0AAV0AEI0_PHAPC|nr:secreted protein [Phakopsora pachyrhizi]
MLFNSNVILFALTFALGSLYQGSEAQDLAGLPNCGQNCLLTAFTTSSDGCTQSQKFTGTSNSCYSSSCTSTEAATAKSWGAKTCASVGVNVTATLGNTTSVGTVIGNGTNPNTNSTLHNGTTASTHAQNSGGLINVQPIFFMSLVSVLAAVFM